MWTDGGTRWTVWYAGEARIWNNVWGPWEPGVAQVQIVTDPGRQTQSGMMVWTARHAGSFTGPLQDSEVVIRVGTLISWRPQRHVHVQLDTPECKHTSQRKANTDARVSRSRIRPITALRSPPNNCQSSVR